MRHFYFVFSMVADVVLFNSKYNMDSFLSNINSHLKLIPDYRPKTIVEQIKPKCHVLHYPIMFPEPVTRSAADDSVSKGSSDYLTRKTEDTGVKGENIFNESEAKILNKPSSCEMEDEGSKSLTAISGTKGGNISGVVYINDDNHTVKSQSISDESDHIEKSECDIKADGGHIADTVCNDNISQGTPVKRSKIMEQAKPLHIVWPHRW